MIHTARQSPKFRRLVRLLRPHVAVPCVDVETIAVGLLERLWHATANGAKPGNIGKYEDEDIAEECGWHLDAQMFIELLVQTGYLDTHEEHRLVVHDWHQHAPNHVKGIVKRAGGFVTGEVDDPTPTPTGKPRHRRAKLTPDELFQ